MFENEPPREAARKIINKVCIATCGLGIDDLPDLPCVMYAVDEMEDFIKERGFILIPLIEIAKGAVRELLEEEGFPLI